ncbi:MAG TPA: M23 family metallopeptidase [Allocoleopsis sp.]
MRSVKSEAIAQTSDLCPKPALERLTRYTVKSGETLESIAQKYNLIPATLMGFNPSLRSGKANPGAEIVIPPYNGVQVTVPAGQTWRDVAATYKVRADVLFEINGCQAKPTTVFVPGVNWSPVGAAPPTTSPNRNSYGLTGYPLPTKATVLLGYGWRLQPAIAQVAFHSGIDLAASVGTNVLAAGDGVVAFAEPQGTYGNLVVINHAGGRQSRYAQLGSIKVRAGQTIQRGAVVGTVGTTGTPSSQAAHLHFEVRYNSNLGWVAEDPEPYVQGMKVAKQ